VPPSASAFAAVGGHGGMLAFACGRAGGDAAAGWPCALLVRARALRGAVLKPLAAAGDARAARERAFYASVFGVGVGGAPAPCVGASCFAGAHALRPLLPAWLGECAGGYVALEDLTARCAAPCVLDVKLGRVSTGPDAPAAKAAAEAAKCPSQAVLAFRLTGLRVADGGGGGGGYRRRGRSLRGEAACAASAAAVFADFLGGGARAAPALRALLALRAWAAAQNEWRLFGSSVLLVYDAAAPPDAAAGGASAHIVDFAHAWRVAALPPAAAAEPRDEGFLAGVDNVISCLLAALAAARAADARALQREWLRAAPAPRPDVPPPFADGAAGQAQDEEVTRC
jgi:hypothetical protein